MSRKKSPPGSRKTDRIFLACTKDKKKSLESFARKHQFSDLTSYIFTAEEFYRKTFAVKEPECTSK